MRTALIAFGTRPEGIKLAPVIQTLRRRPGMRVPVVNVGQHAGMLEGALAAFGIEPDHRLAVIRPGQSLEALTSRALGAIAGVIRAESPDIVVVQGDTTTTMVAALAAFYAGVPVAHVEAGLRTHIRDLPFPEEMNRRLTGTLASLHFAPTDAARANLLRDGVDPGDVLVTGNTVVDAVRAVMERGDPSPPDVAALAGDGRRLIVVTAHRRESWGVPMEEIGAAIGDIARSEPGVLVVFPIHPNPLVRKAIGPHVRGLDNIRVVEPLPYLPFVHLMAASYLLVSDSGGIQEEAAALKKPVLVMRDVTERGEGIATGTAVLVGRRREAIVAGVRTLLSDPEAYRARTEVPNPYGDGRAAERIADRIMEFLAGR